MQDAPIIKLSYYENLLVLISLAYYDTLLSKEFFTKNTDSFLDFINQDKTKLLTKLNTISTIKQDISSYLHKELEDEDHIDNKKPKNASDAFVKTSMFYFVSSLNSNTSSVFYDSFKYSISNYYHDFKTDRFTIEYGLNKPLLHLEEAVLFANGLSLPSLEITQCLVEADKYFNDIKIMALDSCKLKELKLSKITSDNTFDFSFLDKSKYKVKPQDFLKWAYKYNVIDLDFFKSIKVNIKQLIGLKEEKESLAKPNYSTNYLELMHLAINEFWLNYNPNKSTAPVKKQVVAFLQNKAKEQNIELSPSLANSMDTIIRHETAKKGGNRKSNAGK